MIKVKGNIVDVKNRRIFAGCIDIEANRIKSISPISETVEGYIIPGFIDAHVHIESSMLTPHEFGRIALTHGTVGVVCDPHEIANVCGLDGVKFMIENSRHSPLKFSFGAPSCVPATPFDTNGAELDHNVIDELLSMDEVKALAEMMNFPGVINGDKEVNAKIASAKKHNKPVDGHAPGITGANLQKYFGSGISTDHECTTLEEALEKINFGVNIQIREGSACKDFDSLHKLISSNPDKCMFCCDDLHPDNLVEGHINNIVSKAVLLGYDIFDVLKIASTNAIDHYNLDIGSLEIGDFADFIMVNDLKDFIVKETWINGKKVYDKKNKLPEHIETDIINNFNISPLVASAIGVPAEAGKIAVILAQDKQVTTGQTYADPLIKNGCVVSNVNEDILKIVVLNRYKPMKPGIGFIKGFNLKSGAIASSVSHDSHNIIAVGVDDSSIVRAINAIIDNRGGIVVVHDESISILTLPIAGIISNLDAHTVSNRYKEIDAEAEKLGCTMKAPLMTLAFMSLLVIPELKINENGLFDLKKFNFVPLWNQNP